MSVKRGNILFVIVLVVGLAAFAYRKPMYQFVEGFRTFDIRKIELQDMLGYQFYIPEGMRGYVVFYTDMEGCTTCLNKLDHLKNISENTEGVGFFSILREASSRQRFGEMMATHGFPGDSVQDPERVLERRLGLGQHAFLMFFDRNGKLISSIPLEMEHEGLRELIYRYVEEM